LRHQRKREIRSALKLMRMELNTAERQENNGLFILGY
jgi:hypothetical protein